MTTQVENIKALTTKLPKQVFVMISHECCWWQ